MHSITFSIQSLNHQNSNTFLETKTRNSFHKLLFGGDGGVMNLVQNIPNSEIHNPQNNFGANFKFSPSTFKQNKKHQTNPYAYIQTHKFINTLHITLGQVGMQSNIDMAAPYFIAVNNLSLVQELSLKVAGQYQDTVNKLSEARVQQVRCEMKLEKMINNMQSGSPMKISRKDQDELNEASDAVEKYLKLRTVKESEFARLTNQVCMNVMYVFNGILCMYVH